MKFFENYSTWNSHTNVAGSVLHDGHRRNVTYFVQAVAGRRSCRSNLKIPRFKDSPFPVPPFPVLRFKDSPLVSGHPTYNNNFLAIQICLYCQIRCIALRVLRTSEGCWVFLFRQSFEWGRGYANHNTTRSQTASPACDSYETGKRNLRIRHYIKLKNFALLPEATSFCGQRGCGKRGN